MTLIATWAVKTSRLLPVDVPLQDLTEEQLIEFWADPEFFDQQGPAFATEYPSYRTAPGDTS